jgi:hypothetical protein
MKKVDYKTTAGANLCVCLTAVWLCLILFSCDGDEEEIALMWIAAEREMITSSVGGECYPSMKYKMNEQDNWSVLGQRIGGFDYEEGYEYLLRVKITHIKHPVADQPTETYALIEIVSKTYKPKIWITGIS